jgi:hypothetical protein
MRDVERVFEVVVCKPGQGVVWRRWFAKRGRARKYMRIVRVRVAGAQVSLRDRTGAGLSFSPWPKIKSLDSGLCPEPRTRASESSTLEPP